MTEKNGEAVAGVTYASGVWTKVGNKKCYWLYPSPKDLPHKELQKDYLCEVGRPYRRKLCGVRRQNKG